MLSFHLRFVLEIFSLTSLRVVCECSLYSFSVCVPNEELKQDKSNNINKKLLQNVKYIPVINVLPLDSLLLVGERSKQKRLFVTHSTVIFYDLRYIQMYLFCLFLFPLRCSSKFHFTWRFISLFLLCAALAR